jgi:predicted O-methyltransferase YrrM
MSSRERYLAVDAYFDELYTRSDPRPSAALVSNQSAGLPAIDVSPTQGKLLRVLARAQNARNILEIGTLGGYSTLWLAGSLPDDGRLVTLEIDPKHAEVARANFARAGLADRIELRLGPAIQSLRSLEAERREPFDLIFIDADKSNNPHYIIAAINLSRPGTLIVVDNVVRGGSVVDADSPDPNIAGTRRAHELLATHPRLVATAIQTVGSKGHDGFALAVVVAQPDRATGARVDDQPARCAPAEARADSN